MIKCNNDKKKELLDFLVGKPSENCFLIGDIENFDFEEKFIDVWILENKTRITSVLLRYYRYYIVYCDDSTDIENIYLQINKDKNCLNIAGLEETIDKISHYIKFKKIKREYLSEVTHKSFIELGTNYIPVKATKDDIEELFVFHKSIPEFKVTDDSRDSFGQEIINNTGRIYYLREGDDIVSSATLTAENSINGMIIGVSTAEKYRRKGYAKVCMNALCKEIIESRKTAILFYNNEDAGKLYKKIGFKEINRWAIGVLK